MTPVAGAPARRTPVPPDPAVAAAAGPAPVAAWPAPGTAEVATPGRRTATATTALTRAGDLPIWIGAAGTESLRTRVELLGPEQSRRLGITGPLIRLNRADPAGAKPVASSGTRPGKVVLEVDYAGFRAAAGADYAARLRLIRLPDCALAPSCRAGAAEVPTHNRVRASRLRAEVEVPATGSAHYAVVAAASGSTGSFSATELTPSARWQVGLQSGDFTWSYPLKVPQVPGPEPQLALSYSSGAVDGRMGSSNNQPSWVGEGFDLVPGYIQRSYRQCQKDTGGNAGTQDQCWVSQNATAIFSGVDGELVRDDATGTWRAQEDDGWRVELLTGANNGDNDGEYWRLTSPEGTQYYFGLNRLPGWSSGRPETQSTWTAPVFGNHAGEPCRTSTPATSWCQQAYRWNLDYVVDRHGDVVSYHYQKETNSYGRWNGSPYFGQTTPYTRGGYLTRIDYGQRADSIHTVPAPARIVFTVADRCRTTGTACDPATSTNWKNWPDTPWDQSCASNCTYYWEPSFWTGKRLASVTTQLYTADGYTPVDSWTLRQSYPDPYPSTEPWGGENDASRSLWLNGITRTGHVGGTASLPELTFSGVSLANRHNSNEAFPSLYKWRVAAINNESGGRTEVSYSSPQCGGEPYLVPDRNVSRCYPHSDLPSPYGGPDVFYKYVVDRVTERDLVGGNPDQVTAYEYVGGAAWRYDEADTTPTADRDWNQWRGYEKVRVRTGASGSGDQTLTEHLFLRGMNGDPNLDGTVKSVKVRDSGGGSVDDQPYWRGFAREKTAFGVATGAAIETSRSEPVQIRRTAVRARANGALEAYLTGERVVRTVTTLSGVTRTTEVQSEYDSYGRLLRTNDLGDVSVPGDDACNRVTYADNLSDWVLDAKARVEKVSVRCDATPNYPADLVSDQRFYFDGSTVWGAAPTSGDVTRVEEATGHSGGAAVYVTTERTVRDAHGRIVERYDALGNRTTTGYSPASAAPPSTQTVTDALGQVTTTTFHPLLGEPVKTTDQNNRVTELTYDPLGRTLKGWAPGRDRASQGPTVEFGYTVRNSGPSVVETRSLRADGSGYRSSYTLHDGLLRERQVQAPSPGGGRIITDTRYDQHGRVRSTSEPFWNNQGTPGTTLVDVADAAVPALTRYLYDGANRETAEILLSAGVEKWRTTTSYGGDWEAVDPPAGQPATRKVFDGLHRVVELHQFTGDAPIGPYQTTRYTYTTAGQLATVTDAAGNVWRHHYDLRGREIRTDDPDSGTSTSTYDDEGRIVTTTDSRDRTLAYRYDALGRKTGLFEGSASGPKLAEWSYDTAPGGKGLAAGAVRYAGGHAYRTDVLGYDAIGRPTGNAVVLPAAEGALAGRYETRFTYQADGQIATTELPAAGDLPAETLRHGYGAGVLDLPTSLSTASTTLVQSATYTELTELRSLVLGVAPAQVVREFGYETDTRRPATALTRTRAGSTERTVSSVGYTYDPTGNLTRIADTVVGDTQCFRVDHLRRLTSAWTPGSGDCAAEPAVAGLGGPAPYWHSYGYDVVGNRTSETRRDAGGETVRSYAYPAAGDAQPHTLRQVTTTEPAGTRTDRYGHDADGNLTSRTVAGVGQELSWDAEGQLAAVTENGRTTSYLYDAEGNRLIRRDSGGTTVYLGDTELRLATGAATATGTRHYTFGDRAVAVRAGGALTWLVPDHHGTGELAVDAATLTVTRRYLLPFGGARGGAAPSWPGERGFVGGVVDRTGLIHLGAREYDPETGRFVSVDPFVDTDDPQQLHGYAYGNNNPVTFSDPDGLLAKAKEKQKKKPKPDPRLVGQEDQKLRKRIVKIAEKEWERTQRLAKKYGGLNNIPESEFNKYYKELKEKLGKKLYEKMFGTWFGKATTATAWCAVFVTWVLMKAGVNPKDMPQKNAAWATNWGRNKGKHPDPRPGDIVVYGAPGEDGHVEIVTKVHANGKITTIGGNRGKPGRVNKQTVDPRTARAGANKLIWGYISPPVYVPGYPGVQGNWPWTSEPKK